MPPGKKTAKRPAKEMATASEDIEPPLTEIEKERAKNIMRRNEKLQQLGITRLTEIVRLSNAKKRPRKNKNNDQLSESTQHEDLATPSARGASSKRVLAPNNLEQTRCTRQSVKQKEATTQSLVDATEVPQPVPDCTSIPNEEWMDITEEGTLTVPTQVEPRGVSMGIELDNITRGLGTQFPVVINEGKRRPEPPMQAAKLASEGGMILRQHIPILTSWKEYKNDEAQLTNFKDKLAIKFSMIGEKNHVTSACVDLLKGLSRQMRHRLKKKHFDGVAANQVRTTSPCSSMTDEQWQKLVEMWSDPKHKEKCANLRVNRSKVRLHGCTGSRSYIAAAYAAKQEKYKDTEPTTIDLFKMLHCSKTKGFSDDAKKAADDMEAILTGPVQEGEQEKTCTEIVSQVLSKSSTFLRNVGLQQPAPKSVSPLVQELRSQLDAEKEESVGLRQKLQRLEAQAEESKANAQKQAEETDILKKKMENTENLIKQMIAFGQSHQTTS